MWFLTMPPVPPPTVSDLPGPLPVADPPALLVLAATEPPVLLPVAMAGASLLVLAAAEPPLLPPVAMPRASLLLNFTGPRLFLL